MGRRSDRLGPDRQRRRLLKGALLPPALAALASLGGCAPYHAGPISDHFDGARFFNPWAPRGGGGFWGFLQWRMTADDVAWPETVPPIVQDRPPPRVEGDALRLACIGQASFLLQHRGLNIVTDPVFSEVAGPFGVGPRRVLPPGVAFEALPRIDAVLISHNHYDHMDLDTIERLTKRDAPLLIVPLGNRAILESVAPKERIVERDWGEIVPLSDAVQVRLAPAQHWSSRKAIDRNQALWCAFVIHAPSGAIYHAGDTGYGPHLAQTGAAHGPFRLAMLPIGAYEPRWFMQFQHMNPMDAVMAHRDLGSRRSVGMHWGVFDLTDEARDAPLRALAAARDAVGLDAALFEAMAPGANLTLDATQD